MTAGDVVGAASLPNPVKPRWSKTKTINIVCATVLFWTLFWQGLGSFVHIGLDTQAVRCLPWTVFAVRQSPPATLERGKTYVYLAHNIPKMKNGLRVVKYVAAVAGDRVMVGATGVTINGRYWGPINLEVMKEGKLSMEQITTSYVVPEGKVLVLGTEPRSWDGRYWGLVRTSQIAGRAYPLW